MTYTALLIRVIPNQHFKSTLLGGGEGVTKKSTLCTLVKMMTIMDDPLREQGRGRRGRPRLRWKDCVKREVKKAGEEKDWKEKTRDRGGWKIISDEAVKKLWAEPHP